MSRYETLRWSSTEKSGRGGPVGDQGVVHSQFFTIPITLNWLFLVKFFAVVIKETRVV